MTENITQYYERRLQELALQIVDHLAAKKQTFDLFKQDNSVRNYDAYTRAADQYSNTHDDFYEIVNKYADYINSQPKPEMTSVA